MLKLKVKKYFTILLAVTTVCFTTSCETVSCNKCGGDGRVKERVLNEYETVNGDVVQNIEYYTCDTCGGSGKRTIVSKFGGALLCLTIVGIVIAGACSNAD